MTYAVLHVLFTNQNTVRMLQVTREFLKEFVVDHMTVKDLRITYNYDVINGILDAVRTKKEIFLKMDYFEVKASFAKQETLVELKPPM